MIYSTVRIPINRISFSRISVSFTWDDNLKRHITQIAPLFEKNGLRCTFYVNPGRRHFLKGLARDYCRLARKGFEIGSHGFIHRNMIYLSDDEVNRQFQSAVKRICNRIHQYPITFAFPHHSYSDILLAKARLYHLESRNSLNNSYRVSLKTSSTVSELVHCLDSAIRNQQNLVFSGHSVIFEKERTDGKTGEGYKPLRLEVLKRFLYIVRRYSGTIDVLTFAQASVKEFLRLNSRIENRACLLDEVVMGRLAHVGVSRDMLVELV